MTQGVTQPPSERSKRTLLGLGIAMGGSLIVAASLNYLLTPMVSDLGLTDEEASLVLAIPSIASLLIVFVAGRWGDRRGHRKVIVWMGVLFVLGCLFVTVAPGFPLLILGFLFAGLAATAIQIVVFSLLSDCYSDPKQRAWAFGTFGMVSPLSWMLFPVLTGALVADAVWRIVPAIWVVVGVVMVIAARFLLPAARSVEPLGEVRTPILAGLTVVFVVQALSRIHDDGLISWSVLITFALAAISAALCGWLMRRNPNASFSLQPLKLRRARLLLVVVVIIVLINTVFLMTIAFQYLYGLSVLQTALIMVPAQAAAILGSKLLAGPMMRRFGVTKTAAGFFSALVVVTLGSFAVTVTSPLWVPATYVLLYNLLAVSASITVASGLLATATDENSGLVSAYRGSGQALGGVLAVVLMNSAVFALAEAGMVKGFEANGLSSSQAVAQMEQIQASTHTPTMMSSYSMPLPSGIPVDSVMQDAIANGIHINGVLGAVLSLICVALILRSTRPDTPRRVAARSH